MYSISSLLLHFPLSPYIKVIDDFLYTVDNVLDASLQNIIQSQLSTNSSLR